jgi:Flp pilus assembly protein TadG
MAHSAFSLRRKRALRGSALILTALALIPLLAMVAFAVDWGRICVSKAELQRAADSAAMAGAWELRNAKGPASRLSSKAAISAVMQAAKAYSVMNTSMGKPLQLQDSDIQIGYLADARIPGGKLETSDPEQFNTVRVSVRRDAESNGAVPMFFARILGKEEAESKATATATFIGNVAGFKKPLGGGEEGPYLPMLPFTLDLTTWKSALSGEGPDEWKWDSNQNKFVTGSDGVPEFNLYPQDTGAAANRGIVKIGTNNPDTPHVARQILNGVSLRDWEFHNGSLTFDENGEIHLEGTPGLRATFQNELSAIRGQGRIVPIFSKVEGSGNNAIYTIVEWGGVRIIEVELTGNDKRVIVQAGEATAAGTIPAPAGQKGKSKFVNSRVWLAQ